MKTFVIFVAVLVAFVAATDTNKVTTKISKGKTAGPGYTKVYDVSGQSGNSKEYKDYMPDLKADDFDDVIVSACTTGLWFYYEQVDYNVSPGSVYWMHGVEFCGDFPAQNSGVTSSLKYAGSPYGLNYDSFTLYEGQFFTGFESFGETDYTNLGVDMNGQASSLVITGVTPWTFYSGLSYSGHSVCVYPNTDHDIGADGTQLDFGIYVSITAAGIPDNSVYSVAKGCYSKNIVRPSKLEALHRVKNGAMGVLNMARGPN